MHPIETYKENEEQKEEIRKNKIQRAQDATALENVDTYTGSSIGQKDIPYLDEEDE